VSLATPNGSSSIEVLRVSRYQLLVAWSWIEPLPSDTARAFQVIPTMGPFSGLAMGLAALFSAVVLPGLAAFMLRGLGARRNLDSSYKLIYGFFRSRASQVVQR